MTEKLKVTALLLGIVAFMVAFTVWQFSLYLPPCIVEDDTFCYWDAANRGNGMGHSFISFWEGMFIRF